MSLALPSPPRPWFILEGISVRASLDVRTWVFGGIAATRPLIFAHGNVLMLRAWPDPFAPLPGANFWDEFAPSLPRPAADADGVALSLLGRLMLVLPLLVVKLLLLQVLLLLRLLPLSLLLMRRLLAF